MAIRVFSYRYIHTLIPFCCCSVMYFLCKTPLLHFTMKVAAAGDWLWFDLNWSHKRWRIHQSSRVDQYFNSRWIGIFRCFSEMNSPFPTVKNEGGASNALISDFSLHPAVFRAGEPHVWEVFTVPQCLELRLDTGAGPYGLPLGLPVGIPVEILTCRSRLPVATGPWGSGFKISNWQVPAWILEYSYNTYFKLNNKHFNWIKCVR